MKLACMLEFSKGVFLNTKQHLLRSHYSSSYYFSLSLLSPRCAAASPTLCVHKRVRTVTPFQDRILSSYTRDCTTTVTSSR